MKMKNISQHLFLLILISAGLAISSCNQNAEPPVEQEETDMPADRKVTLTQDQVELAGFKFGQPELKVLSGHVDAPGKLSLPSGAQAKISPVFGGIVHSIEVTLGQTVKKGQVLAYLTDPEYIKIQNEYLSAHINLNLLEDEYKRQQRLFDQQVSSEKKRIQAKTEFQTTKAEAKALELMISQIGLDPEQVIQGNLYRNSGKIAYYRHHADIMITWVRISPKMIRCLKYHAVMNCCLSLMFLRRISLNIKTGSAFHFG